MRWTSTHNGPNIGPPEDGVYTIIPYMVYCAYTCMARRSYRYLRSTVYAYMHLWHYAHSWLGAPQRVISAPQSDLDRSGVLLRRYSVCIHPTAYGVYTYYLHTTYILPTEYPVAPWWYYVVVLRCGTTYEYVIVSPHTDLLMDSGPNG